MNADPIYRHPQRHGNGPQSSRYWDAVSRHLQGRYYHDTLIGHIKRDVHLKLITRWCRDLDNKVILKTDLFEEAHGPDQFLFELTPEGSTVLGIDISPVIAAKAKQKAADRGLSSHHVVVCDVLALPFWPSSLDVIVSNSTLDHFPHRHSIPAALSELYRVLKPGGTLIITLDNRRSISYFLTRFKSVLRPDPFYIGETCSLAELRALLQEARFHVSDTTAIMHGMENHTSAVMRFVRKLNRPFLNKTIYDLLVRLERLEAAKTRYLTGAFIAAKALKSPLV